MKKLRLVQTVSLLLVAVVSISAQNGWEQMESMPQATNWYGSCMDPAAEKAYFFGGQAPSATLNLLATTQIYDFSTDQWSSGADMMDASSAFSAEMIDGKIYTFGEYQSPRRLTNVMEYDPGNDSWKTLGELPEIFWSHGSIVYDGLIYLFGGYDNNFNPQKSVRTYDPATDSWSQLPDMLMADAKSAVCVYDDEIYLFNEKAQKYTPSDSTWTLLNSGTNDIVGYAAPIVHGDIILLFGGYKWTNDYPAPYSCIYAYYPESDTMMKLDSEMPFERFTGGHKYQNFVYLFGGHYAASLGSVTNEVWRFDLDNFGVVNVIDNPLLSPQTFTLGPNYPNPFTTSTYINYELAVPGEVQLEIYDCLGKRIILLAHKKQFPGSYQLTWDASGVEPGIYFCKLKIDGFEQTRKLIKAQ